MKKAIAALMVLSLMAGTASVTAFAHCGGYGRAAQRPAQIALCPVEDCAEVGPHEHDGAAYCNPIYGYGYGCRRG